MDQVVSTSICNDCVLNLNHVLTFKKRVLDAQELINSSLPPTNDSGEEYFEDTEEHTDKDNEELEAEEEDDDGMFFDQIENVSSHDVNSDENDEVQVSHGNAQIELANKQQPTMQAVIRPVFSGIVKKRPNNNVVVQPKVSSKKSKVNAQNQTERFTLQINECLICPAILNDILDLKEHIDAHPQIKCKACKRQFVRYSNLKRHFNSMHSKPKPFMCDICNLGFNFSVNLQAHAALHYSGKIQNGT